MKCLRIVHLVSVCLLAAGMQMPVVHAAETSALIEEVVVTARKRAGEEALQDTPISATVFTEDKIELINAIDVRDLGLAIPNVRLVEQGNSLGYGSFYIRGAGVSPSVPSFDPAVGMVIDGVPLAQAGTAVLDVFDLETVGDIARTTGHAVRPQRLGWCRQHAYRSSRWRVWAEAQGHVR